MVPMEVRRGLGSLRAGVTDDYEPLCDCYEPNLGPLLEQQLVLTSELPLKPPFFFKDFFEIRFIL